MVDNITFLVFTYNEARRIEYVLRCFSPYGKIVIMDNHSTDNTREIAETYGAKVYLHTHPGYVEEESVANNALSKVTTEWVYWAFADEILPKKLLLKLQQVASEDKFKLVNIPRKNLHYGILNLNFDSGGRSPRFFKKGYVDFTGTVIHQTGKFIGKSGEVLNLPITDDYSIFHCSTYNIQKFEMAHSRYSDIESQMGHKFNIKKLLLLPIKNFVVFYFIKGAYKEGLAGLIMVLQYCFFVFNVHAKIWEKTQGITLDSIEQNYDRIKEKLLCS